jgi:hypothetical protein
MMLPGQQPHDSSMQRSLLCALLWAASLAATTPAFAWTSAPARNPANGHYYAFFNGSDDERFIRPAMPFADALTRAASMSHLGVPGHLATITSQAEQDFVLKHLKELGRSPVRSTEKFWIAASDAAVEGEWRWVAGPEAGQQFWRGSVDFRGHVTGQSFGYHNWLKSSIGSYFLEPNNAPMDRRRNPDGEDYLALYLSSYQTPQPSYWNDVIGLDDQDAYSPRVAIVEFSVPEPSSGALIAGAGFVLVTACRRQGKSEVPR